MSRCALLSNRSGASTSATPLQEVSTASHLSSAHFMRSSQILSPLVRLSPKGPTEHFMNQQQIPQASHWLTLPILPWSLLILSWQVWSSSNYFGSKLCFLCSQVFLGSRRAERRSLNVPKETLSIFLMMIPLARSLSQRF